MEYMTGMLSLLLLLVVMIGLALLARRFLPVLGQQDRSGGFLRHLGSLALTPQCSVALVQAGREVLVLGLTAHSVTLLTRTEGPISKEALRAMSSDNGREPQWVTREVDEGQPRSSLDLHKKKEGHA